ncbi:phage major tail tube protein [Fusicatenibacter saccharivorans]|jgi:P2 family phage contractile tail tube protein|uniref:phage major tail tube protein n=1 Tax=Fusicatenibacter saccharivorans TaxID=1150298 RepID=UPI0015706992|nr:phage major tail tube protein [Fusicatenibacter saccharivorans]NSD63433.1 phage major tail tube protein [Fusicatenibacter saccharivorans]DAW26761.1 MAG TPA: tail tube protein [Caudoviricetes sp.]
MIIPEVINNYNVYDSKAKKLIGISGEVELPSLEAITDTIEAAGILGEVEDPVTGQFSSMKIKIPFSNLYTDQFNLMDTTNPPQLTLRGSMQVMNSATGGTDYVPVKIVTRGKSTTSSMGKLSKGKKGEPEIEMEVLYLKVMINNKITLELDKLNFKYVLNGKDMLAKIRSQC